MLSGDFNFTEQDILYTALIKSGLSDSKHVAKDSMDYGTVNYFLNLNFRHFIAVDFLFVQSNEFDILSYRVDPSYRYDGKYISDHFPLIVDFRLN